MTPDEITARLRPLAEKAAMKILFGDTLEEKENHILSTFTQPIADWLAEIEAQAYERCGTAAAVRDGKLISDFNTVKNEPSLTYIFDKWAAGEGTK